MYGPVVSTLKGRSTRPRPEKVDGNWVEILIEVTPHNRRIKLMIDVFYINKIPFLTSIDGTILLQGVVLLQNRTKDVVWESLEKDMHKVQIGELRGIGGLCGIYDEV